MGGGGFEIGKGWCVFRADFMGIVSMDVKQTKFGWGTREGLAR